MASRRAHSNPKAKSATSRLPAVNRVERLAILGPPLLLGPEEDDAYDELLARICVDIGPVNVIEEMFVADLVSLQWDIMGLRRLKTSLIRTTAYVALKNFLLEGLEYCDFQEEFEKAITQALRENVTEQKGIVPEDLARRCVRDEPGATKKLDQLLKHVGQTTYTIYDATQTDKAEELARWYVQGNPDATKQVNQLLARRRMTVHDIIEDPVTEKMDVIERINRLMVGAETRRNASLREIDRRRSALGQALRRTLEAQDSDFEALETTSAEDKNAA